jgi:hypothetical protein
MEWGGIGVGVKREEVIVEQGAPITMGSTWCFLLGFWSLAYRCR